MNHPSSSAARLAPVTARGRRSREKLLRAAERVFGEKGYEDTSIAEICRTAGCALGSFYVYFTDKRAAFVELVDSLGARLRGALTRAVVGEKDRLAIERAGLRAFFRFLSKHRRLYRIIRQAEFVDPPSFRRYYEVLEVSYISGLKRAVARGEIKPIDPVVTAYCLMGIADFLGMRLALWERSSEAELDAAVEAAMQLVSDGLRAGPALAALAPPPAAVAAPPPASPAPAASPTTKAKRSRS